MRKGDVVLLIGVTCSLAVLALIAFDPTVGGLIDEPIAPPAVLKPVVPAASATAPAAPAKPAS